MIWTPAGRSSRPFTFVQAPPESSSLPHLESNAPLDTKECSSSNAVTIVEEGDKSTQCKFIFSVGPLRTVDLEISPRRTKKDRRTPKKWSAEEEDALRAGVGVYKTKWASILDDQRFASVLYRRSNVDLKDKWRNLSKKAKAGSSFGVKK